MYEQESFGCTFCEFVEQPGVNRSKAAIILMYGFTQLWYVQKK